MRRYVSSILALAIFFLAVWPSFGYAWHRGPYWPRYYYRGGGCCNAWGVGAAIVGGAILGAVVGNIIIESARSSSARQGSYAYQGQADAAYRPGVAYARPDPEFIARYGKKSPSGEWVSIPGQWVGDKWVPEHKVWVSGNQP